MNRSALSNPGAAGRNPTLSLPFGYFSEHALARVEVDLDGIRLVCNGHRRLSK